MEMTYLERAQAALAEYSAAYEAGGELEYPQWAADVLKACKEAERFTERVTEIGGNVKRVLDPCCGSRMFWFDRQNPSVLFGDRRAEVITVTDRSRGNASGTRTLRIEPDQLMDFRALPFEEGTFRLVSFDPPHLVHAGPKSWLAAKYGKLSENWRDDLRAGFAECFRVLEQEGILVFKWNETQIKVREVLELTPHQPLFGQVSGRSGMTHWLVFMKAGAVTERVIARGELE